MTSPSDRAKALLARATHPSTPEEEARTSALLACRLIHEHDLLSEARRSKPETPRTERDLERAREALRNAARMLEQEKREHRATRDELFRIEHEYRKLIVEVAAVVDAKEPARHEPRSSSRKPRYRSSGPSFEIPGVKALRETTAALLCISPSFGKGKEWVPKGQICGDSEVQSVGDEGALVVTRWIAEQRGWT